MSLADEIMDHARELYREGSDAQDRLEWLTDRKVMKLFRNFDSGQRKSCTQEMRDRLGEFAAWSGHLPADDSLREIAETHIESWNAGPYGKHFVLSAEPVTTLALVRHYLGETGTHRGQKRRTLYWPQLSTEALDTVALYLRPYCPHPWYSARADELVGSKAEQWLRARFAEIEPGAGPEVVRAIIDRTSQV